MKASKFRIICLTVLIIISGNLYAQEENDIVIDQIVGVFDGYNEELDLYSFSSSYLEEGIEMIDDYQFNIKNENFIKEFDLKSNTNLGKKFIIKFKIEVVSKYNEDEEYDEIVEEYTVLEISIHK